jgi:hypothetical protein
VTIVVAGDGWEAAADVAPPEWPNPPNSAGWPKALPVVVDVGENYGGAAEGHRFHGDG